MILQGQSIRYINSITHEGKVVLFGMDSNGKVWYSIKQDGFEDSYLNTSPNERDWEDWQESFSSRMRSKTTPLLSRRKAKNTPGKIIPVSLFCGLAIEHTIKVQ